MRVTIMNAAHDDLWRVAGIVNSYRENGFADGSRTRQRQCVIYGAGDAMKPAAVWGGPDHIRVAFEAPASRAAGVKVVEVER